MCFSKDIFFKYCNINEYIERQFKTFDYPVWLSIAKHTKCKYLDDITSAYRTLPTSISNNQSFEKRLCFEDSVSEIQQYIINKFGLGNISQELFTEYQLLRYIDFAMQYNKYFFYLKLTRKLKSKRLKFKLMHYFPFIWYIQHKLRVK